MSVNVPSWEDFQNLVSAVGSLEDRVAELEEFHEAPADQPPHTLVGAATEFGFPYTWPDLIEAQEEKLGGLSARRCFDSWMPASFSDSNIRHDNGTRTQIWSFKLGTSETVSQIQSLLESVPDKSAVYVIPYHEPADNMDANEYWQLFDKVANAYSNVPGFAGIGTCLTQYSVDHQSGLDFVQPEKCTFLSIDYYPELEGTLGDHPVVAMSNSIDFANTYDLEFHIGEFGVDRSKDQNLDLQLQFLYEVKDLWQSVNRLGPLTYFDVDDPEQGYWRLEPGDRLTAFQSLRDYYQSGV